MGNSLSYRYPTEAEKINLELILDLSLSKENYDTHLERIWNSLHKNEDPFLNEDMWWKSVGFQGPNPATDVRGGGQLALKQLAFLCDRYPETVYHMINDYKVLDENGKNISFKNYPFAAASINITNIVCKLFDIDIVQPKKVSFDKISQKNYWHLISSLEDFHEFYCYAFCYFDKLWAETDSSYMEFGIILKRTQEELLVLLQSGSDIDKYLNPNRK
jgi:hypothetical protein